MELERKVSELVMGTYRKIDELIPYLKIDEENIKEDIFDRVNGIGWENIISKKVFKSVVKSMIETPPNKMAYSLIPDKFPTKIKEVYDDCLSIAEQSYLMIEINYLSGIGFVRQALSRHIGKELEDSILGLTKAFRKGKETSLELQLPFMSQAQKDEMLIGYMPDISKAVSFIYKKIDRELKAFDIEIEEKITKIIEEQVEVFISTVAMEYNLV